MIKSKPNHHLSEKQAMSEGSDSDNWLSSFADARYILDTQFSSGANLGDADQQLSAFAALNRARGWLGELVYYVGEVPDGELKLQLSFAIECLIREVVSAMPVAVASSEANGMYSEKPFEPLDEEAVDVEILHDPDYSPALNALKERGDPKPLARLLKQGKPVSDWVGQDIGVMLDPSKNYQGVTLIPKTNNGKSWREMLATLVRKRDAGNRLRALALEYGYESAVRTVMDETGMSETWVKFCHRVDNVYLTRASQGYLGYDDEDVIY